ncbi:MAG: hypothetical protein ABIN91_10000 [Mucilaginibacter sp.]|uniref:hypothetical protein n=1 Tax=Mucilaginibacter sp. TaxID=1882438 RepID=UPI003264DF83
MVKKHTFKTLLLAMLVITVVVTSCKKDDNSGSSPAPVVTPIATLGLYQYSQDIYKRLFIPIQIASASTSTYFGVFDTGSTGLTLDAEGLIPASMITTSGITIIGDSVNVNGITIMNKPSIMAYGDAISSTKEYGYLAYATFTLGTAGVKLNTKRIPFFLYYKIVDGTGKKLDAHSSDVFGVGPGFSYASNLISSPLSYFDIPTGGTNGFKLAQLSAANFTTTGNYVAGLLTIGLIPADFTATSGFIMHPLTYSTSGGYSANIPATITYGSKTIDGQILFDTGTPAITVIEDKTATAIGNLPASTAVSITTNRGFKYSYTTASTTNLTQIQNPNNTNDYRTIFSLSFFVDNEYLTDYGNHQIGLKNN